MVIGTAAAVIGGSLLAAGGSAISGASANRAARRASQTAADTSIQTTQMNNDLAREVRDENRTTLAPWQQMGLSAAPQVNDMLRYLPDGSQGLDNGLALRQQGLLDMLPGGSQEGAGFDAYKRSTGYDARLQEGMGAVRGGFSGQGTLQSGAALRGLQRTGQTFASNEFGNFQNSIQNALSGYGTAINGDLAYKTNYVNSMMPRLNTLVGTRDLGFNAAGAQTGVATNYSGQVQANNSNNADTISNAALYRANNTTSPFGNAMSMMGGGLFGYGSR